VADQSLQPRVMPTAWGQFSRYSHGVGNQNRLMYDNQYDREIIRVTGIAAKSQKRLFIHEHLRHIVYYCISNKKLLSANFWSDPISPKMDKISTKMC
jgi:hypothetical protein